MNSPLNRLLKTQNLKIRFIVVGIWNTIVGYLVFIFFDSLFSMFLSPRYLAYLSAMFLGQIVSVTNSFIFHKYYTFRSKTKGTALLKEFLRFITTYVITFFLSLILLPFFVEILLMTPKIAGAIVVIILAVISYFGHSKFSFRI